MNTMINRTSLINRVFIMTAFIVVMALSVNQTPVHAANEDGKVIFLIGNAWVEKTNGGQVPLSQGMGVVTGDTIVTAENGQVHIRTSDGGYIAIMPNSRFLIENYKYSPQSGADSSADVSQYQLLKGGFRSITGAIGQNNKQAYRVKTPVATIGIRGTDYTARLCEADCVDVNGAAMQDGLYLGVWQGGVTLSNSSGVLDVDVNQFGYVAGAETSPVQRAPVAGNVLHAASGRTTNNTADVASNSTADSATGVTAQSGDAQLGSNSAGVNPSTSVIALPSTGTATYTNTQNTSVTATNINGATGATVTNATMTADFGTMTASTSIDIDMTQETVNVSVGGMQIDQNTATFGTNASSTSSVTSVDKGTGVVNTVPTTGVNVNGEFTGDSTPTGPTGANMSVDIQATDPLQGQQQMQIDVEMTKQ